jgi:hypothetical protein
MEVSGQLHAAVTGHFTLGERYPGTHYTGDSEGPRASLGAMARESNLGRPVRNLFTILTELPQLLQYI